MEILIAFAVLAASAALLWYTRRQENYRCKVIVAELENISSGARPDARHLLADPLLRPLVPGITAVADEHLRLRALVNEEEFNLQTILASMEEGVMVVDAQHVIRRVNPSFLALFDVKNSPLGQTVLRTLREADFQELVTDVLKTGEAQSAEVRRSGGGSERQYAVHAVPMRDNVAQLGVLVIFRDVTRLKQLEEVRREFVANVSHELRTPLSIFHGYVETLLDHPDLPPEDLRGVVEILHKHSLRLNALLEDLLILARLESRRDPIEIRPIDMERFIKDLAGDWAAKLARKSVQLHWHIAPNTPALPADERRLEQVFHNLIENAVKYTSATGNISVQVAPAGEDLLEVRVQDDGAGIPPADLPHIFERFYRADKARSREHGGTGLGLSIVKHIVQSHGGTVRAESRYGKGTTIILQFPRDAPPGLHEGELIDPDAVELTG